MPSFQDRHTKKNTQPNLLFFLLSKYHSRSKKRRELIFSLSLLSSFIKFLRVFFSSFFSGSRWDFWSNICVMAFYYWNWGRQMHRLGFLSLFLSFILISEYILINCYWFHENIVKHRVSKKEKRKHCKYPRKCSKETPPANTAIYHKNIMCTISNLNEKCVCSACSPKIYHSNIVENHPDIINFHGNFPKKKN